METEALGKIGDKKCAGALIEYLFEHLGEHPRRGSLQTFFGDYADIILEGTSRLYYIRDIEHENESDDLCEYYIAHEYYHYSINEEPVEELCRIISPISNNILHKVANLKDVKVVEVRYRAGGVIFKTLSFESLREMARKELERRGNPPYDPSVYLDEKSWKL